MALLVYLLKLQRRLRHDYRADDIRNKSNAEAADKNRPDNSYNRWVDVKEFCKSTANSADNLIIAGFIKLFVHIISLLSKYIQGNARFLDVSLLLVLILAKL